MIRVLPFVLVFAVGCAPSDGRNPVSGSVTYDGKPIRYGTIAFEPDGKQGNRGPAGSAEIRDGRYTTPAGFGAVGGPHLVRITGWDVSPEDGILPSPLVGNYTTQADIPAGGGTLDFAIPAKSRK